jgi:hypothetical protein
MLLTYRETLFNCLWQNAFLHVSPRKNTRQRRLRAVSRFTDPIEQRTALVVRTMFLRILSLSAPGRDNVALDCCATDCFAERESGCFVFLSLSEPLVVR